MSVSLAIPKNGSSTVFLDSTKEEESECLASFCFSLISDTNPAMMSGCQCNGTFTLLQLETAMERAFQATLVTRTFIRKLIEKKTEMEYLIEI